MSERARVRNARWRSLASSAFVGLVAALVLSGCRVDQASETEDLGTVKASVGAVGVYARDAATKHWRRDPSLVIRPGATVWTVDDARRRPSTATAHVPGLSTPLTLVEVMFQNAGDTGWKHGFVLAHCFDWDTTQHVAAEQLAAGAAPTNPAAAPAPSQARGRAMCGA
jgi:hypothetical protein